MKFHVNIRNEVMMIKTQNIYPLSDFQRNAREFVANLQESGQPIVLTVNGKATLVIQDADSYQALLDELEIQKSASIISERIKQFATDEIDIDAKEGLENLRGELGISH
jgi:prevent-host-death family protein